MPSLLRTIFYGIKVIPLNTLAAMRIGPRDARKILQPTQNLAIATVFPCFSSSFDNFINIHEYANKIIFFRHMTSVNLSYNNIGINHGFQCSNIRWITRKVFEHKAAGRVFKHLPSDPANV